MARTCPRDDRRPLCAIRFVRGLSRQWRGQETRHRLRARLSESGRSTVVDPTSIDRKLVLTAACFVPVPFIRIADDVDDPAGERPARFSHRPQGRLPPLRPIRMRPVFPPPNRPGNSVSSLSSNRGWQRMEWIECVGGEFGEVRFCGISRAHRNSIETAGHTRAVRIGEGEVHTGTCPRGTDVVP